MNREPIKRRRVGRVYDSLFFSMFFLGMFSVVAQIMFMREMLVVFLGNELGIGTILAGWLIGISVGAYAARLISFITFKRTVIFVLAVVMAFLLPLQVYIVRIIRAIADVPAGEYAPFGVIFWASLLVFLPTCFSIGIFFPFTCALVEDKDPVSTVYTFEAVGSMVGGILLTFILLPLLMPSAILLLGSVFALAAALLVIPRREAGAAVLILLLMGVLTVAFQPGWLGEVEKRADLARWRACGVLPAGERSEGEGGVRHVLSRDTIFQNLALFESYGQYSLYGHGRIMFSFPDPIAYEHSIHFVMGQNPSARSVLLLGGNPVGDMPELLKYPIKRLVYVELDPGVGRVLMDVAAEEYDAVLADHRVELVVEDAPRYVARSEDKFDVVIVNAPDPSTAWENRYYTKEFYESVRDVLTEKGFMCTALTLSVRLQSETAHMGASVYKTLKDVFPAVLVTAGGRSEFFAGGAGAGLTFDRNVLFERSKQAGLKNKYFMPEYFLGYDDIEPEKTAAVERRFMELDVPMNSNSRPITYFYNLLIWSNISGSVLGDWLGVLRNVDYRLISAGIVVLGILSLVAGFFLKKAGWWARFVAGAVIGNTGFCAMAIEVLLIFIFQALFGYVYTRIGFIVAMFMLGLVCGASFGREYLKGRGKVVWKAMLAAEILLFLVAVGIPLLMGVFSEVFIYVLVVVVGGAVGAEFAFGNRLYRDAGGTVLKAAAITDASDHMGAAVGALVMGVLLIPVFGIWPSCVLMASLKLASIMMLLGVKRGA